ncbi:MAG: HisA/HisF-related TIM barrel protein [Clostridia bacterium]|nr:HisA/HisF-related TIM barrel protein [Clostridia bacterium]
MAARAEVIPAIDVRAGKCVRLMRGDFARETIFFDDPAEAAQRWVAEGAGLLHVVDLDGAKEGHPVNLSSVRRIVQRTGAHVQLGGGLRTMDDVRAAFASGVSRVLLGTWAVSQPEMATALVSEYGPDAIAVAVDVRDGRVLTRGWVDGCGLAPAEFATTARAAGVSRAVVTDARYDGMLCGPNVALGMEVAACGLEVTISGGVSSLEDVARIAIAAQDSELSPTMGRITGMIIGQALYTGLLSLRDALREVQSVVDNSWVQCSDTMTGMRTEEA